MRSPQAESPIARWGGLLRNDLLFIREMGIAGRARRSPPQRANEYDNTGIVMPVNDAQLRWQCRRGMRELDILLTNYFESDYLQASEEQKQAFRELLALPDPDLIGYLLGGQSPPNAALANVVNQIRDRPHA